VSGRGESFKSGGRVVKNVTGYDLCKLMAGAWGTLAALTEVTVKVLPRPETEETVTLIGLDDRAAVKAMTAAMGSSAEVSGAAHMPAKVAQSASVAADDTSAVTALRLEGVPASITHRRQVLEALLTPLGTLGVIEAQDSRALWASIRDVTPLASRREVERPVWRISTAPTKGAEVGAMIVNETDAALLYDWAGGLVWAALPVSDDAGAGLIRRAVAASGGHATLIRADAAVRAAAGVFEPQDAALAALTKRVKESFDPNGVLNPGRMWAGV
jgi:glycolate oxidase FAD binding subunit